MQETQVQSLIWEDPTFHAATKPMGRDHQACALEPGSRNYWAPVPWLLKPVRPKAHVPQQEKAPQWEVYVLQLESSPNSSQLVKSPCSNKNTAQPKVDNFQKKTMEKWPQKRKKTRCKPFYSMKSKFFIGSKKIKYY